jgi:hypothetical protein
MSQPEPAPDLQTALANLEIEFLDDLRAIPRTCTRDDRETMVRFCAFKFFSLSFSRQAQLAYANTRAGMPHSLSASDFRNKVDRLLLHTSELTFSQKIWPHLRLPESAIAEKYDFYISLLRNSQRELLDELCRRAWEDERDGERLPEDWQAPRPEPELESPEEAQRRLKVVRTAWLRKKLGGRSVLDLANVGLVSRNTIMVWRNGTDTKQVERVKLDICSSLNKLDIKCEFEEVP